MQEKRFSLSSEYQPQGDQPKAIAELTENIIRGVRHQVLLGVTGSGKTFTMANLIERVQKPTLVISHNKTLAAQLYLEFRKFFPDNAVEYFVSYYDYYQPEAYIPQTDTYIEKDSSINENLDKMRHSATRSLLERRDVIVVASVSCIYGLGSPQEYQHMRISLEPGHRLRRNEVLRALVNMQYSRNDLDFHRGTFRVRGDMVEIFPSYEEEAAVRLEFFGDELDTISLIDPMSGRVSQRLDSVNIYPGSHYVLPREKMELAIERISRELEERLAVLKAEGKLLEAQRLEQRTNFDLEMLREIGYCHGIENYSRHMDGRQAGEPPYTLLDYLPADSMIIIDESHVTIPQLRAMWAGDYSRKKSLVDFGFRLPSAFDNRPLTFEEFNQRVHQVVYVSATPAEYELAVSQGLVVEQVIRPTGLMDPKIEVRPASNQVDDLLEEIRKTVSYGGKILVTTLTKRMAEDLTEYYTDLGVRVRYLHSEIDTIERTNLIRELRQDRFDVLVGINLLREGLDIPEVSLVAILDADKEGFLRSSVSLIQTAGRAARHINGRVIMYADQITNSMRIAIDETERRRKLQMEYNRAHGITPESIRKAIDSLIETPYAADYSTVPSLVQEEQMPYGGEPELSIEEFLAKLEQQMKKAAARLDFEEAARIRDRIREIRKEAEAKKGLSPQRSVVFKPN
ncbi:MAG: excinuclease ABC subunit UvrB [bacterium]|nr:excinuclease ABC subunit UvrB [bacterium]